MLHLPNSTTVCNQPVKISANRTNRVSVRIRTGNIANADLYGPLLMCSDARVLWRVACSAEHQSKQPINFVSDTRTCMGTCEATSQLSYVS